MFLYTLLRKQQSSTLVGQMYMGQTSQQAVSTPNPDNLNTPHCRALPELQLKPQNKAIPKQLEIPGLWLLHSLK